MCGVHPNLVLKHDPGGLLWGISEYLLPCFYFFSKKKK